MSFAIEVPAETNPLTTQTLFNILKSASSSNQTQIQTGTKQLENWEKSPGFYSTLQAVYIDRSLPEEVRYLSILQLKNGIDKHWRKTAQNAISKEEKAVIRSRCLESCLTEPKPALATQSAVVIARIIRYEFPHDWPDAISSIVDSIRESSRNLRHRSTLSRALLVLLHVIKELSTAKLQRSRTALQASAPEITGVLFTTYVENASMWMDFLRHGGEDEGGAMESMDCSLLALRILRRLIVQFDFPNRHDSVRHIWGTIWQQFNDLLAFVGSEKRHMLTRGPALLIESHLLQFSKLHLHMAKNHPAAFALLPDTLAVVQAYWVLIREFSENYGLRTEELTPTIGTDGDEVGEVPFAERLTLKGLLILRACCKMAFNPIQTFKYQQREDKDEKRVARELVQQDLLTQQFASDVMEVLMTRYFVFTSRDLKQWEEEPDEWEKTQEGAGDDWEFSIRTCSEKLFLDLVVNYKDFLVPSLVQILERSGLSDNQSVLRKDSVYAAIGLTAPVLEGRFDFDAFLRSTLVTEVQRQEPGTNILRRRIAIVLGQWLPVKEGLDRPLVYQIFQHLLDKSDPSNDQVVRVTAGRQLHAILDPFEFTPEPFAPFAPMIIGRLIHLTGEVDLTETKLALLNTLSLIVIKMEKEITPMADQIISLLPAIWEQAKEEYILQQSILGILSRLVTSLESDSTKYHAVIVPLIQSSIDLSSPTRPYLLEDALDLWGAVLEQTPAPPPTELVSLVQHLFPMFDTGSDVLRKALEITEAYTYLMPLDILANASVLLGALAALLDNLRREAAGSVTHLVELLIESADQNGGAGTVDALAPSLVSSNFLPSMLASLREAHTAHQTTGPNRKLAPIDGLVENDYLSILARLCLASPSLFISACKASSPEPSIEWLVEEWFAQMDSISSPDRKKANCLALTALLETEEAWVLSYLQNFISLWTDLTIELVTESEDKDGTLRKVDCLVYNAPDDLKPDGPESPAAVRERQLLFADPVHRVDIRDFIRDKLQVAINRSGGMDSFRDQWLENVDKDVVRAFGDLGIV